MRPSGGSGVAASMPARRSASELTHMVWWSLASSTTGRFRTAASRAAASPMPAGSSDGSYPPPSIHSSSGFASAYLRTRSTISAIDRAPTSGAWPSSTPPHNGWMCPSRNPGTRHPPARSTSVAPRSARPELRRRERRWTPLTPLPPPRAAAEGLTSGPLRCRTTALGPGRAPVSRADDPRNLRQSGETEQGNPR